MFLNTWVVVQISLCPSSSKHFLVVVSSHTVFRSRLDFIFFFIFFVSFFFAIWCSVKVDLPTFTEKDVDDIVNFGIKQGVEFIAASFIRTGQDVLNLKKLLADNGGSHIKIISKIENQEGLINYDEILKHTDGVMVARGDVSHCCYIFLASSRCLVVGFCCYDVVCFTVVRWISSFGLGVARRRPRNGTTVTLSVSDVASALWFLFVT